MGINEGNSFTGALTYNSVANFESNNLDSASYTALLPTEAYAQDLVFRLR